MNSYKSFLLYNGKSLQGTVAHRIELHGNIGNKYKTYKKLMFMTEAFGYTWSP